MSEFLPHEIYPRGDILPDEQQEAKEPATDPTIELLDFEFEVLGVITPTRHVFGH